MLKAKDFKRQHVKLPQVFNAPPRPVLPVNEDLLRKTDFEIVDTLQTFINQFEYNYRGKPFVKMKRNLGISHVLSCAMDIIHVGLPIQCVEATFIGLYCTNELKNFIRIPLSFKSCFEDGSHKHMVLVLKSIATGKWGAIGISRRPDLMYKPLLYESLYDLIIDYKKSYENNFHRLLNVYFGYPFLTNAKSDDDLSVGLQDRQRSGEIRYCRERSVKWKEMKLKMPVGAMYDAPSSSGASDGSDSKDNMKLGVEDPCNCNLAPALSIEYLKLKEQCDLYTTYCDVLNEIPSDNFANTT